MDVQAMMQGTGVDVSYETEGTIAVEIVVQTREKNEDFNVILPDWLMPGQDGARAVGVDAFMPKPFFVSTSQQTLENLYANREKKEASPL